MWYLDDKVFFLIIIAVVFPAKFNCSLSVSLSHTHSLSALLIYSYFQAAGRIGKQHFDLWKITEKARKVRLTANVRGKSCQLLIYINTTTSTLLSTRELWIMYLFWRPLLSKKRQKEVVEGNSTMTWVSRQQQKGYYPGIS